MIEPSLALYGEVFARVNDLLDGLLGRAQARYAMLVDRKGFVLAHREAVWAPRPPDLDSVATLIAGDAAATAALAKLFGERRFNELVLQGEAVGLYVEEVSSEALLAVVFDVATPVGRVKLFAGKLVAEVAVLLEAAGPPPKVNLGSDFASSAGALLDDLFGAS